MSAPQLGLYRGKSKDYTCPGDNVTWLINLHSGKQCTIECISEMSYFKGGQPPWRCEGTWEFGDGEVELTITKPDAIGPRKDQDFTLPLSEDGSLTFKGASCAWREPPPNTAPRMSLKEIKERLVAVGIDPAGCIERADLEAKLARAGPAALAPLPASPEKPAAASPAISSSSEASPAKPAVAATSPAKPAVAAGSPPKHVFAEAPAPAATHAAAEADSTPAPEAEAAAPAEAATPVAAAAEAVAPAEAAAPAATPVATAGPAAEPEVADAPESGCYTLEQLTDKRTWEKLDVVATEREKYLSATAFTELFGVSKEDFDKQPKWKKDGAKKKHGLF